jgi:hypothetical protein
VLGREKVHIILKKKDFPYYWMGFSLLSGLYPKQNDPAFAD